MKKDLYNYKAKILSVYDGDGSFTVDIMKVYKYELDFGFNIKVSIELKFQWLKRTIRLYGVDTPEMRGNHKEAGKVVRDYVRGLILNREVEIKTIKDKTGKYGRLLADIYPNFPDQERSDIWKKSLSEDLIEKGFAKEYLGGTKKKWTKTQLRKIYEKK